MRRSFLVAAMVAAGWAVVPSADTVIGMSSLAAAVSLLAQPEAKADTAVQPGWRHPCGRNPRCMERVEGRRLARIRAQSLRTGSVAAQ
jgi:hypothetical protein